MKRIILLVVLVVVLMGGWYGFHEFNRRNRDLTGVKADFELDANSLIAEFQKDSAVANRKYVNKIVNVSGNVGKIDADGNPVIIFLGGANMSAVKCSMDSAYAKDYEAIKPGNKILVKGVCTGGTTEDLFGTDVTLNNCVLQKINQ